MQQRKNLIITGDNNEETEKGNEKAARKQCHLMIGALRWAGGKFSF